MSEDTSMAIDGIEASFLYDVTKTTVALFYLIQGMETASAAFDNSQTEPGLTIAGPRLTHLRTFPAVSTVGSAMLGPSGEAVQLAFKGWIGDIIGTWERSRSETRNTVGDEGIRPEVECMGDLNKIRNDLLHNGGVASKERSGKCKVLKWFKPGERMLLTTNHAFDFLNQMNFLTSLTMIDGSGGAKYTRWSLLPDVVQPVSLEKDGVYIISFRLDIDNDGPDGAQRFMLSAVFSDGAFVQSEVSVPIKPDQYLQGSLTNDGNIAFDGGQVLNAGKIYDACFGYLSGDRRDGLGISGPNATYIRGPGA